MNKLKVKQMMIGIAIVVALIIIDQVTKTIVVKNIKGQDNVVFIKNFITFTYVENDGGAWGVLSGRMWLFYAITIFAIGLFGYMMKNFDLKGNLLYSLSVSLMLSGTIGNFIDRLFRKIVVDFIDVDIFSYRSFPVFNVADMCLTVGVCLLIVDILFNKNSHFLR